MKKMKKKEENKGRRDEEEGRVIKGGRLGRHLRGERACCTICSFLYKEQILDPQNLCKSQVGAVVTLLIPDSTESIYRANLVVRLALYVTSGLS